MAGYSDRLSEMRLFKQLAENRKIRYFRTPDGPSFTLSFPDYLTVDPITLALFLASAERAFGVRFSAQFGGYGCFKVSYTVEVKSKEEAENIAQYMACSEKVRELTNTAISTELAIQHIRENKLLGTEQEIKHVEAALAIVEEEIGIKPKGSLEERIEKLDEYAVKEPPSPDGSFWRLGYIIGSIIKGLISSICGG